MAPRSSRRIRESPDVARAARTHDQGVAARTASASAAARPARLGFTAVAKSLADTVTVPDGYTAKVLLRLGDPIAANVPAYKNDGTDPAEKIGRAHV